MPSLLSRYTRWLHTGWPAGRVEKLPIVGPEGQTNVAGLYICGDLVGVPLLKFALDSGVRAVRAIKAQPATAPRGQDVVPDLIILGAGVAGMAAAIEAHRLGLSFAVIETAEPFSTLVNFPKGKPIFTYPEAMTPEGELQVHATVKEALLDELRGQVASAGITTTAGRAERIEREGELLRVVLQDGNVLRARRVLVAIGRSGDFRRLGVPGENLEKVYNRLHDPADFRGRDVLVVGGGDSALEAAIALSEAGARTTLSYRGKQLARAKSENVAQVEVLAGAGRLALRLGSEVSEIRDSEILLRVSGDAAESLDNDVVFTLIGRDAPLAFLRRSGVLLHYYF